MIEYIINIAENETEAAEIRNEINAQKNDESNAKSYPSINIVATKKFNIAPTNTSANAGYPRCGGIAIIGNKLFAIKSRGADYGGSRYLVSNIFKCTYTASSPSPVAILTGESRFKGDALLGHGNAMTTNGSSLFVATGICGNSSNLIESNNGIGLMKFSQSGGTASGNYSAESGYCDITSIAYFGSNNFIAKPSSWQNSSGTEYAYFDHISLNGSTYGPIANEGFYCHNPKSGEGYNVAQDIAYHTVGSEQRLYVIYHNEQHYDANNQPTAGDGNCNIILVYNLSGSYGSYNNTKCYEPIEMFVTKKKTMAKYEIESMAFPSATSAEFPFYLFANADADAIYKVELS